MCKYTLYTRIKGKRKKIVSEIIEEAFNWCINKWGASTSSSDELWLSISWQKNDTLGLYDIDENEIIVYVKPHLNIRDLIDTVIHEFTHYRQPMYKYSDILKKTGYNNHPLEVEAREKAKTYRKECWQEIKNNLKLTI